MVPEDDEPPDADRVGDRARRRLRERAERVETILGGDGWSLEEVDYPVSTEDLAVEYGDQPLDLPNETETLGDVFDRLVDEEFDSPRAVREAVYGELTGSPDAGGPAEYNDERNLEEVEAAGDEAADVDRP